MDSLTVFKAAFLNRCAEEGLTIDQIQERVKTAIINAEQAYGEKKADLKDYLPDLGGFSLGNLGAGGTLGWLFGKGDLGATAGGTAAGSLLPYIIPAAGLGTAALAGGGLMLGKHLAESSEDPMAADEIKAQELIGEYKRLGDKARLAARQRKLRENRS